VRCCLRQPEKPNNRLKKGCFLGISGKIVTPVKTGVQPFRRYLQKLDSGFRRNDEIIMLSTLLTHTSASAPLR